MDENKLLVGKSKEILIGEPVLTKYERARIIGSRALQLSQGAPSLIAIEESYDFRPIEMAKRELNARVLPLGIARRFPNDSYQIIPIQWLKDRESIADIDGITEI